MDAIALLEKTLKHSGNSQALAAVLSQEDTFLVMDCSGSMDCRLRNGRHKMAALKQVVDDVKADGYDPQMVAFAGGYWAGGNCFMVGDVPAQAGGGTPMAEAIDFAKEQGAKRIVMISDGVPDSRDAAMLSAMKFGGRVDVVYVGDAGDAGSAFLEKLAKATGGERFNGDLSETRALKAKIAGLLAA